MEEYRVSLDNGLTIVEQIVRSFRMSVQKNRKLPTDANTALLEATLYVEDGSFVKYGSYIFEALGADNKPLVDDVNIDVFKNAIDFYFNFVLKTDHYVKSIPKCSSLCDKHLKVFQF